MRPATQAELDQLGLVTGYAYGGAFGDGAQNVVAQSTRPEWTLCAFDGESMVSTFAAIPFTVRANGKAAALAGVSAIATRLEYRRQGLVRRIQTQAFADMRDRGQSLAALWASQAAIYQRYGYAMVTVRREYRIDGADVRFHDGDTGSSRVEQLDVASGFDLAKQVYIEFIRDRMCYLHRGRPIWHNNALRETPGEGPVYVGISRDGEGQPNGYVIYTLRASRVDHASRPQEIVVRDLAWLCPDAYRTLWAYFARHDLVGRIRWPNAPVDDPAWELFAEPRLLHARDREGMWLRVVDVRAALEARGYDGEGEIRLEIRQDAIAPWNEGTFGLEVAGGSGTVSRKSGGGDLVLEPKALASLYSGFRSARELRAWGLLKGEDEAIRRADALFATRHAPHCPDNF